MNLFEKQLIDVNFDIFIEYEIEINEKKMLNLDYQFVLKNLIKQKLTDEFMIINLKFEIELMIKILLYIEDNKDEYFY